MKASRRAFLKAGVLAGGGLSLGWTFGSAGAAVAPQGQLSAFVRIASDGRDCKRSDHQADSQHVRPAIIGQSRTSFAWL